MGALPLAIRNELKKPAMVATMQRHAIAQAAPYVQYELVNATPVGATALLRQSTQLILSPLGTTGFVGPVGSPSLYAGFVVSGTAPHFPPIDAIAYWASRVLGYVMGSPENRRAAFAIAHAIAIRGTRPNEYVRRAADKAQPRVTVLMQRGISQVIEAIQ
jgi:hypothetical protein